MKDFNGTKGPWHIKHPPVSSQIIDIRSDDNIPVCSLYGIGGVHCGFEIATHNALLISAAPELLESLQDLVLREEKRLQRAAKWHLPKRWFTKTYAAVEIGRKAIDKALGYED